MTDTWDSNTLQNQKIPFYIIQYFTTMQYVSAVALASLSGKAPNKDTVLAILKATGKPVDEAQVDAVLKAVNNRKVDELISKGLSKVSVGAPSGSAPAKETKKEEKKEDKKKQEKKPEAPKKKEPEPEPVEEELNLDIFG